MTPTVSQIDTMFPRLTTFLGLFLVAATFYGAVHHISPFYDHMYPFAWYGLILFLDGLLWWNWKESLIFKRPREFFVLCYWSAVFWFFFEIWNLRLQNWYFVGAPAGRVWPHAEAYIDFATVLPGMFLLYRLLFRLNIPSQRKPGRTVLALSPGTSVLIGTAMLTLPLVFPDYFFFCVWGSLIFLLEPLLMRFNAPSLLARAHKGHWREFIRLLLAGLLAGLYWELCNFWSLEKWVYTVPFFSEGKLFEMPYLGFLGFPPFCVECFVMTNAVYLLRGSRHWMPEWDRKAGAPGSHKVMYALLLVISLLMAEWSYEKMQHHTVESRAETFQETVADITPPVARRLAAQGWKFPEQALAHWETVSPSIPEEYRKPIKKRLDLATLLNMGSINARLLEAVGIRSRTDLAESEVDELYNRLKKANDRLALRHTPLLRRRVASWIAGAKRTSPLY